MQHKSTNVDSPLDPRYRRVQFLKSLLWVIMVVAPLLALINQFFEQHPIMVALEYLLFVCGVGLYIWLRRGPNAVVVISWLVTGIFALVICVYVVLSQGQAYALYWLATFPPVAYFLLGGKWGLIASVSFVSGIFFYLLQASTGWTTAPFSIHSLLNILIATTALIIILRHIERTRAEAFHFLQKHSQRLEYMAVTDRLTGLFNRTKLDHALSGALGRAQREQRDFSIILLDIDHFKKVNDPYGHQIGDKILIELAQLLRGNVRNTDVAGRWGGEEFLLVLPEQTRQQAVLHAERIRNTIAAFEFHDGIHITASFGVASYRAKDDASSIIRRGDKALYEAKAQGRNCTVSDAHQE
ncbi:GGDEF domain-containing protein [Pseudidiomarina sp. E22-M8]|uniref:GGDEF domain-containing protein n=1 Tax=Pseudidiomarina sp. E22-M8 TaxID=3424768 RepID=UPI00403C6D82